MQKLGDPILINVSFRLNALKLIRLGRACDIETARYCTRLHTTARDSGDADAKCGKCVWGGDVTEARCDCNLWR